MSGNTLTLVDPPEDDPVSTFSFFKSQAWHVFSHLNSTSLDACMYVWQGEGTSAAAGYTSVDEETVSLDSRRLEVFSWKYLAYLVHKGYEVSDVTNTKYVEQDPDAAQSPKRGIIVSSLEVTLHYAQIVRC